MTDQQPLPRRIAWFAPWTWKRRWWVVGAVAILVIGYPISIGPIYFLMYRGIVPFGVYATLYEPLFWVAERNSLFDSWIRWYLETIDPSEVSILPWHSRRIVVSKSIIAPALETNEAGYLVSMPGFWISDVH